MNKENVIISPALPEDATAIEDIITVVWIATYPNEETAITELDIKTKFSSSVEDRAIRIREREKRISDDTSRRYWIARVGEEIVGYCAAAKGSNVNTLQALNILPQYQGQGLGKRFMEQALEWLGNELPISLRVISYNTNAIEFYKKLGFAPTGKKIEADDKLPNGKTIPRIEMIRSQF